MRQQGYSATTGRPADAMPPTETGVPPKQQEDAWRVTTGATIRTSPEIAEQLLAMQKAREAREQAAADLTLFNDDRALNAIEQQQAEATKQRSVLQIGVKQRVGFWNGEPHPSPVQFQKNGTALVGSVLFTPEDAALMILLANGWSEENARDHDLPKKLLESLSGLLSLS
jgi:hypothetical protein